MDAAILVPLGALIVSGATLVIAMISVRQGATSGQNTRLDRELEVTERHLVEARRLLDTCQEENLRLLRRLTRGNDGE